MLLSKACNAYMVLQVGCNGSFSMSKIRRKSYVRAPNPKFQTFLNSLILFPNEVSRKAYVPTFDSCLPLRKDLEVVK